MLAHEIAPTIETFEDPVEGKGFSVEKYSEDYEEWISENSSFYEYPDGSILQLLDTMDQYPQVLAWDSWEDIEKAYSDQDIEIRKHEVS